MSVGWQKENKWHNVRTEWNKIHFFWKIINNKKGLPCFRLGCWVLKQQKICDPRRQEVSHTCTGNWSRDKADSMMKNGLWFGWFAFDMRNIKHSRLFNAKFFLDIYIKNMIWFGLLRFGLVLWYIDHCRLFNAKFFLDIYIKIMISKYILRYQKLIFSHSSMVSLISIKYKLFYSNIRLHSYRFSSIVIYH